MSTGWQGREKDSVFGKSKDYREEENALALLDVVRKGYSVCRSWLQEILRV